MSEPPAEMDPTIWRTLKALRGGARLSRNRHFDLFADPRARRAIRLHRYLQGLARALAEADADDLAVHRAGGEVAGDYALRIEFPVVHGRRTAYLSETELRLLAEHAPEVARLLDRRLEE